MIAEKLNNVQLVVFDMAGTTITDNHEVEMCFAKSARETGLFITQEQVLAVQGWSKRFVFEYFWKEQLGRNSAELEERTEHSYAHFRQVLETYYLNPELQIFPTLGCVEFLTFLRNKGIYTALSTGFYRKVTDIILGRLGWLDQLDDQYTNLSSEALINYSISSDEVAEGRPAPCMIEKIMDRLGIRNPERVINIGDTPSDLESGIRAGVLASVGLVNGTHSKDQLSDLPNHGLFESLKHLHEVWNNGSVWPKSTESSIPQRIEAKY